MMLVATIGTRTEHLPLGFGGWWGSWRHLVCLAVGSGVGGWSRLFKGMEGGAQESHWEHWFVATRMLCMPDEQSRETSTELSDDEPL